MKFNQMIVDSVKVRFLIFTLKRQKWTIFKVGFGDKNFRFKNRKGDKI